VYQCTAPRRATAAARERSGLPAASMALSGGATAHDAARERGGLPAASGQAREATQGR